MACQIQLLVLEQNIEVNVLNPNYVDMQPIASMSTTADYLQVWAPKMFAVTIVLLIYFLAIANENVLGSPLIFY